MIKVSVLYQNGSGKSFDIDYYTQKHIPMVRKLLGSSCINASAEKGIAGGAPGEPPTYLAMGHLFFKSVDDFTNSFNPNASEILADLPNFTDAVPVIQISSAVMY